MSLYRIQKYTQGNMSRARRIRLYFLKLLAGKMTIIMNANLRTLRNEDPERIWVGAGKFMILHNVVIANVRITSTEE